MAFCCVACLDGGAIKNICRRPTSCHCALLSRPASKAAFVADGAPGIFKKFDSAVEIKTPNSGEAVAEGARDNAADIYVATANSMVSAIGDGADFVFFANTGYSVLKLLSNPSITRAEQLRGKRVGTGEAGSSQDRITRETLRRLGLDADKDVLRCRSAAGAFCG